MTERRPVFHGRLGAELKQMRESRGWSLSQVVDLARRRRLTGLSPQQLRYLEEGRTKHPEADALQAVAAIYNLKYEELVARFVQVSYGTAAVHLPTAAALTGDWRLLMPAEHMALDAWRQSSPAGRKAALAVLKVSRPQLVRGKERRQEDVGPPPGFAERRVAPPSDERQGRRA